MAARGRALNRRPSANPSPAMKLSRVKLAALALTAGVAGLAGWLWRAHARSELLRASIPPRPSFTAFPNELTVRISESERSARRGAAPTIALAELAQLYHANGFLTEAAWCYRGLTALEPRQPRWPHRLACLHAGFGQLEPALSLWRRTLDLHPDYIPARLRTGDVLLKLNRPAEAADAYARVLHQEPGNPYALLGLARVDLASQRWAAARDRLAHAAERSGGRIGADLLATVHDHLGETARATALRARAKSSGAFHDPPDPWLDEILADCFDVYRLTVAAGFAQHAGDSARARQLIDRALALAPQDAPALYQRGTLALAQRDYERARADFEACVRAAPEFADGWLRLTEVQLALGQTAAAERTLDQGLARCPTSPSLHLERANRLTAAGRFRESVKEYEETLRLRPNDADALVKLAPVYFRLERLDDGVRALHRALAVEPEHPGALTTLALYAIGTGDEPAARAWLSRLRQQPRVSAEVTAALGQEFRTRFGRPPE